MKKLMYVLYLIICKPLGKVWIFAVLPFRGYVINYCFNYVLQHGLELKRLRERSPIILDAVQRWYFVDIHGLSKRPENLIGFLSYRKVNKIMFYFLVFTAFGWYDCDSNQDTTDTGYIKTLLSGERKSWHRIFNPWLRKIDLDNIVYGNAFDLGDVRAKHPFSHWAATFVWNDRNTAMNFQYLFFNY